MKAILTFPTATATLENGKWSSPAPGLAEVLQGEMERIGTAGYLPVPWLPAAEKMARELNGALRVEMDGADQVHGMDEGLTIH